MLTAGGSARKWLNAWIIVVVVTGVTSHAIGQTGSLADASAHGQVSPVERLDYFGSQDDLAELRARWQMTLWLEDRPVERDEGVEPQVL
jgi:hypothetical protein